MTPEERELAKKLETKEQAPPPGGAPKQRIKATTFGESVKAPFVESGKKLAQAGKFMDPTTGKMGARLRAIDPTSITRASTAGVDGAQAGIEGAAARAGGMGTALQNNPVRAAPVAAQQVGPGTTVERQAPIVADTMRGTTQTVQAGQAQAGVMSAAQIGNVERMVAAGMSREDAQVRARQMALADSLTASAAGEGPSLAQSQLNKANEQAVAGQMAMAASARGGNPVLAQRQAMQNVAALQQDNAAKSAELRLAEALQARSQLGQVLDSARGQDISVSGTQAGFEQQANLTNAVTGKEVAIAQAGLSQDASKTNALEAGQTSRFNVDTELKGDLANQDVDLRSGLADQSAGLAAQTATAQNNISTDQFSAKALDEMARFDVDLDLKAKIVNQAATLQAQGMTIDGIAKFMGIEQQSLAAVLQSETAKLQTEQARQTAQKSGMTGMIGAGASVVGAVIAACFPAGEQVLMADGVATKNIEDVGVGEELWGSTVLEARRYVSHEALFLFAGATMTGLHAVWTRGGWTTAADVGLQVGEAMERDVYTLVTSTGVMVVGDALVGDDNHDADELNMKECA